MKRFRTEDEVSIQAEIRERIRSHSGLIIFKFETGEEALKIFEFCVLNDLHPTIIFKP